MGDVIGHCYAGSVFTGVVISQYYASSTFTDVGIGQYYAISVFTGSNTCCKRRKNQSVGVFVISQYFASSTFTGVVIGQVFWVVSLMPVLYSQVHVHPGPQVPCEEEIGGHHEDRIWYEDVRHTQNTFTLKIQ